MSGANTVHIQLRNELENYIKSQYFGKTPLLWEAVEKQIDTEGVLYKRPYIESSPAYKTIQNGIQESNLSEWMISYFSKLADAGLGVYASPF